MVEFRLMEPTPEKLDAIVQTYLNDFPYLCDSDRNETNVWLLLNRYIRVPGHVFYECGDGMILFRDVVPGHKANVIWIQLNAKSPSHQTFRAAGRLMREFMDVYDLHKLEAETADWRVARLLKRLGYEQEGVRKDSFMFRGKLFDHYFLAMVR